LRSQNSKLIRCYSIKNQNPDDINNSVEHILKNDLQDDKGINKKTGTTIPDSKDLLLITGVLDEENILTIKTSLMNHYLLKDLSSQIM
jgi:hypothetical protein